jgi:hypothetical protein
MSKFRRLNRLSRQKQDLLIEIPDVYIQYELQVTIKATKSSMHWVACIDKGCLVKESN